MERQHIVKGKNLFQERYEIKLDKPLSGIEGLRVSASEPQQNRRY